MPQFKRVPLTGSDELFRPTTPTASSGEASPADAGRDAGASLPAEPTITVELTRSELRQVVDALQGARFPEQRRARLTMTEFEVLGGLQERLRSQIPE